MEPPVPERMSYTKDGVVLNWAEVVGDEMGGVPITKYTLVWENNTVLVEDLVNTYTVQGMRPSTTYKFRVRAENVCGLG